MCSSDGKIVYSFFVCYFVTVMMDIFIFAIINPLVTVVVVVVVSTRKNVCTTLHRLNNFYIWMNSYVALMRSTEEKKNYIHIWILRGDLAKKYKCIAFGMSANVKSIADCLWRFFVLLYNDLHISLFVHIIESGKTVLLVRLSVGWNEQFCITGASAFQQ